MTFHVDATFHDGVLKLKSPVALADGEEVRVVILCASAADVPPAANGTASHSAESGDGLEFDDPLAEVIGICDDPDAPTDGAENHDKYLRDPLAGLIGTCEGPGYSLAERHDEIVYGRFLRRKARP